MMESVTVFQKRKEIKTQIREDFQHNNNAIGKSSFEMIQKLVTVNDFDGLRNIVVDVDLRIIKNIYGKTVLHVASLQGSFDCLRILCEFCTQETVNAQDCFGFTSLHYAVQCFNTYCVKTLLTHGANTNIQGYNGCTPLHLAALQCSPELVFLLCESWADVQLTNNSGETPLVCASRSSSRLRERLGIHVRTLALLLKYGSDPNFKDNRGMTAFHYIATSCEEVCATLLTFAGADAWTLNCDGESCVELAKNRLQMSEVFCNYLKAPVKLEQQCLVEVRKICRKTKLQSYCSAIENLPLSRKLKDKLLFRA